MMSRHEHFVGCTNVYHSEVCCLCLGMPMSEWCRSCVEQYHEAQRSELRRIYR
jgi:hypothetical protein